MLNMAGTTGYSDFYLVCGITTKKKNKPILLLLNRLHRAELERGKKLIDLENLGKLKDKDSEDECKGYFCQNCFK